MLDIKCICIDFDVVVEKLVIRGVDAVILNEMKEIDVKCCDILVKVEILKVECNIVFVEIV